MAYFAPGKRSLTACAITCAVEWRSTSRPSSESGVMIATRASWSIGRFRSYHSSSPPSCVTCAASAAFARPRPIEAAISPAVTPCSCSRVEPSGSVIVIVMGLRRYQWPSCGRSGVSRRVEGTVEVDAEQRAELAQHRGRSGVVAAGQHRTREVVEGLERARRVEVVVDGGAHALGVGPRIGAVGAFGSGEEAVQESGAFVEVGVVPLEAGAVVVTHEREADG